ncbi:hypothetical protein Hypma_004478 [Hypsizygus marmoreus]|uniref:Uncharacterized protein n=1 Tax=Hypsizygus marmoreus TaxID=39966 RepID=A0A369K148_HYPMA|nr:hypothetical protein Hypma_004478 [Hypsizygus marmoreus]
MSPPLLIIPMLRTWPLRIHFVMRESVLTLTWTPRGPRGVVVDMPADFGMVPASSGSALFDSGRGRQCCTVDAAIGSGDSILSFSSLRWSEIPCCVLHAPQASSFSVVSATQYSWARKFHVSSIARVPVASDALNADDFILVSPLWLPNREWPSINLIRQLWRNKETNTPDVRYSSFIEGAWIVNEAKATIVSRNDLPDQ